MQLSAIIGLLVNRYPRTRQGPSGTIIRPSKRKCSRKGLVSFEKRLSEKEWLIFDNRIMAEDPLTLREMGKRFDASRESMRLKQGKISRRLVRHLDRTLHATRESGKSL